MKAVKFKNAMGHEQILNLERITSVEKIASQKNLIISYGKDHIHLNFNTSEDRDRIFEQISDAFGTNN